MGSKNEMTRKEFLVLTFTLIGTTAAVGACSDDDNNNVDAGTGGNNGGAGGHRTVAARPAPADRRRPAARHGPAAAAAPARPRAPIRFPRRSRSSDHTHTRHDCGQHAERDHARRRSTTGVAVGTHAHGDAGTGGPDDARRRGQRDGHVVVSVRAHAHVHDQLPLSRSAPHGAACDDFEPSTDRAGRASRRRPTRSR